MVKVMLVAVRRAACEPAGCAGCPCAAALHVKIYSLYNTAAVVGDPVSRVGAAAAIGRTAQSRVEHGIFRAGAQSQPALLLFRTSHQSRASRLQGPQGKAQSTLRFIDEDKFRVKVWEYLFGNLRRCVARCEAWRVALPLAWRFCPAHP